jgi:hypothetical protein
VLLEPLDEGARLRFQSVHDASKGLVDGGAAAILSGGLLGLMVSVLSLTGGKPVPLFLWGLIGSMAATGPVLWAWGRSRAQAWRPWRRGQFEALGAEAKRVVG